jgi:hypothetical protein
MKNFAYLFVVFGLILFTGCEKEDPTPDPIDEGHITLAELNGSWNFISYTYNGTEYDCDNATDLAGVEKGFVTFNFNANSMVATRIWVECATPVNDPFDYDFTKNLNEIKLDELGGFSTVKFELTVESYDGTELKLKLLASSVSAYPYLGGTLTLVK